MDASSTEGISLLDLSLYVTVPCSFNPGYCFVLMDLAVINIAEDRIFARAEWDVLTPTFPPATLPVSRTETIRRDGYTLYAPPNPALQPMHLVIHRLLDMNLHRRLLVTISPLTITGNMSPECDVQLHVFLLPLRSVQRSRELHMLPRNPTNSQARQSRELSSSSPAGSEHVPDEVADMALDLAQLAAASLNIDDTSRAGYVFPN